MAHHPPPRGRFLLHHREALGPAADQTVTELGLTEADKVGLAAASQEQRVKSSGVSPLWQQVPPAADTAVPPCVCV